MNRCGCCNLADSPVILPSPYILILHILNTINVVLHYHLFFPTPNPRSINVVRRMKCTRSTRRSWPTC
ncbi:hypothetical protein HYDPIDRAFT_112695 [Hydnomerulius pinastri MD-312]|uniref:Uncharacterized protein n=1 Tax=Hydnomerulius pinastri MD-312 TaxID=994086 RepID=A0A0C9W8G1_9AGAM|nr:hypothetical protein HYDPIDRAFT_112695 [Hydnomerulius pinastri MD-312]